MVMIEVSEYLNIHTAEQGDIVEIIGEATYGTIKDNNTQKDKRVLNIPVKLGTRELTYTPSKKVEKDLASHWGKDTMKWIGKKFQVEIRKIEAFGKEMDVIRPLIPKE